MKYPGGKNASGTYQRIINEIPPHRVFLEGCAGSAAIARLKRPAERTILVDCDPAAPVFSAGAVPPQSELAIARIQDWLREQLDQITPDWFCYLDPPYLRETCASHCRYRFGMSRQEHVELLRLLKRLSCPVMISGYASPLYAKLLKDWRTITFRQMTRGGYPAEETLWMNYPEPVALHDYRYLGEDHDQRWNFSKRRRRWVQKLNDMTVLQRRALLAALAECDQVAPPELAAAAGNGGADRTAFCGGAVLGSCAATNGRNGSAGPGPPELAVRFVPSQAPAWAPDPAPPKMAARPAAPPERALVATSGGAGSRHHQPPLPDARAALAAAPGPPTTDNGPSEFLDGEKAVVSRRALRRLQPTGP